MVVKQTAEEFKKSIKYLNELINKGLVAKSTLTQNELRATFKEPYADEVVIFKE
jgi:hypothetical protein